MSASRTLLLYYTISYDLWAKKQCWAMVMLTFSSSTKEAEAGRAMWVQDHSGLQSEFQDSKSYTEKPCLREKEKKKIPSYPQSPVFSTYSISRIPVTRLVVSGRRAFLGDFQSKEKRQHFWGSSATHPIQAECSNCCLCLPLLITGRHHSLLNIWGKILPWKTDTKTNKKKEIEMACVCMCVCV